ncbi:hypothetical protein MRX96_024742 [Rhipicephalus microplus]
MASSRSNALGPGTRKRAGVDFFSYTHENLVPHTTRITTSPPLTDCMLPAMASTDAAERSYTSFLTNMHAYSRTHSPDAQTPEEGREQALGKERGTGDLNLDRDFASDRRQEA